MRDGLTRAARPAGTEPRWLVIAKVDNELLATGTDKMFDGPMTHYPTEPEVLAKELRITGKRLRDWLRARHTRGPVEHGARWVLTPAIVDEARHHFGAQRTPPAVAPRLDVARVADAAVTSREASRARRRDAARRHQPDRIRLLLIAEAPPASLDRYFYFEDVSEQDSLFRYVTRSVLGVEPTRRTKAELLARLRDEGVYLIDLSEDPISAGDLRQYVPSTIQRCGDLAPEAVVLIKATVYDAAFEPLKRAGINVIDRRVPFPGSGQQRRFEAEFGAALVLAGWTSP